VRRIPWWGKAIIVVFGILVIASALRPSAEPDHFLIELESRGNPSLQISVRRLDFGEVDTTQPVQRSFTLTNDSGEDAMVNLSLESAPPFGIRIDWLVENQPTPMFVPRGGTAHVVVTIFRTGRESLGSQTYRLAIVGSRAR
jgi:hypothetical protein